MTKTPYQLIRNLMSAITTSNQELTDDVIRQMGKLISDYPKHPDPVGHFKKEDDFHVEVPAGTEGAMALYELMTVKE